MGINQIEKVLNRITIAAFILILLIPGSYVIWFVSLGYKLSEETEAWAQFGDFIGGMLNPFIAFFALYWLMVSVKIQKEELSETRKTLVETAVAQERIAEITRLDALVRITQTQTELLESSLGTRSYHMYNWIQEASENPSIRTPFYYRPQVILAGSQFDEWINDLTEFSQSVARFKKGAVSNSKCNTQSMNA
jgi:hypothetical protein